jgi:hypothetical protein
MAITSVTPQACCGYVLQPQVTPAHISTLEIVESPFLQPDGGQVDLVDVITAAKVCARAGEYQEISDNLEFNESDRRLYATRFADAPFVRVQAELISNFLANHIASPSTKSITP